MSLIQTERKAISSPRGNVSYWITRNENPSAPCMFFLHGLTADHTLFAMQVPHFAERYTVIAWDAPGHARSRPYTDFSLANCADDMRNILLSEGFERAVLIGQSMGGYIAQAFLVHYPTMASAFIAIDSSPFGLQYYSKSDLFWLRQTGWISRLYPHQFFINTVVRSVALTEAARENMRKAFSYYSHQELCTLMNDAYLSFVRENCDLEISCPVLILVGEKDKAGKVISYSKVWHNVTGFPLQVIKDAAHNANYDNPEAVNAAIDGFLNDLSIV